MKSFFIIGTDTDCGKTYVTCKLLEYFQQNQKLAIGLKPVASGCFYENGDLVSKDAVLINQYNKSTSIVDISPWRLLNPISPHLAAKVDNVSLTAENIKLFCTQDYLSKYDVVLFEGAGGLMVPLNDNQTWLDVLGLLNIPVILVVGMKLGCINHSLLTAEVLNKYNISVAGWIANCLDEDMLYLEENIATITNKVNFPLLGKALKNGGFLSLTVNVP
ncbi:MAG: dethiobiotin synthase [Legionellales bacterium RIFCSPHIGHO2_12_FULL_35_11]|nr:MAG: dethiobiotin synthase [Legionellales bacterium RIFCSPHIGHO2_12_FULL_35_11]